MNLVSKYDLEEDPYAFSDSSFVVDTETLRHQYFTGLNRTKSQQTILAASYLNTIHTALSPQVCHQVFLQWSPVTVIVLLHNLSSIDLIVVAVISYSISITNKTTLSDINIYITVFIVLKCPNYAKSWLLWCLLPLYYSQKNQQVDQHFLVLLFVLLQWLLLSGRGPKHWISWWSKGKTLRRVKVLVRSAIQNIMRSYPPWPEPQIKIVSSRLILVLSNFYNY